jgi:hypothetical protein
MKKILIVGCGQLGSRHLQSLAGLDEKYVIDVVERYAAARTVAKERYQTVKNDSSPKVNFFAEIPTYAEYTVCIIATSADVRYSVLENTLKTCRVEYIVFEKVLFQTSEHCRLASKLLLENSVKGWVNCPRRQYPFYAFMRSIFLGDKKVNLRVKGSNWGLACNSIHFVDLHSFLTGDASYNFDFINVDRNVIPAKRQNFIELNGVIMAQNCRGSVHLECYQDEAPSTALDVCLSSSSHHIEFSESTGLIKSASFDFAEQFKEFCSPLQSVLTSLVVSQLTDSGNCDLVEYESSSNIHIGYLDGVVKHLVLNYDEKLKHAPIT